MYFIIIYFFIIILDSLAKSLSSTKTIILSDIDLNEHKTTSCTVSDDYEYTSIFGRRFHNLNYKNIVYIVNDNYMNNVDRFILEKKGANIRFYYDKDNLQLFFMYKFVLQNAKYISIKVIVMY